MKAFAPTKEPDQLTLLIQGPLHCNTIKNILLNQDISRIVISSWLCDSTLRILKELISLQNSMNNLEILMLSPPPPEEYSSKDNLQNIYLQALSTYHGLNFIETIYTVKCRSDEYYTGLSFMAELLEASKKLKVISSNAMVRRSSYARFHLSDHLFISDTNLLKQTYSKLLDCCSRSLERRLFTITTPAEVKLWINFFCVLGYAVEDLVSMSPKSAFKILSTVAELIDVANFYPYEINASCIGATRYLPNIWKTDMATHPAYSMKDLNG